MIERGDTNHIQHGQADDAARRRPCPAAGILPRRRRVVFEERRQQDKGIGLGGMGATSETDDKAAAGRVAAKNNFRLAYAL